MNVSAVGFLFQDKIKTKGLLKNKNYTCTIHKLNPIGGYNKNIISSPVIEKNTLEHVTTDTALADLTKSLSSVVQKDNPSKFIGATIKDGVKETEIHSFLSDKLYAVRTKDEMGKNHFRVMGKNNTQKLLAKNLNLTV